MSAVAKGWNALRREVLAEAVRGRLLPAAEADARGALLADAREQALDRCVIEALCERV